MRANATPRKYLPAGRICALTAETSMWPYSLAYRLSPQQGSDHGSRYLVDPGLTFDRECRLSAKPGPAKRRAGRRRMQG
jgi:hypothetical protein